MGSFVLDAAALDAIAHSTEVQNALLEQAEELADIVRALTPELSTPQTAESNAAEPGAMMASIEAVPIPDGARVQATDRRFHWLEFGTGMRENKAGANRGEMPAYAPFRRGAEAFGNYRPA